MNVLYKDVNSVYLWNVAPHFTLIKTTCEPAGVWTVSVHGSSSEQKVFSFNARLDFTLEV